MRGNKRKPSGPDFSSPEEEQVVSDDEGLVESPDDLRATGSIESFDTGVSLKSDQSKAEQIDFKDRVSPRSDLSSSEEEDVSDDEGLVESSDDLMAMGSMKSSDSGVSFKSDRSKAELTNFKDRVSPRSDSSSPEEKHVVADDEDLVKSSDDQGRETNQEVG